MNYLTATISGVILGTVYGLHRLRKEKPAGRMPQTKAVLRRVFVWGVAGATVAATGTPFGSDHVAAVAAEVGVLGVAFDIFYRKTVGQNGPEGDA